LIWSKKNKDNWPLPDRGLEEGQWQEVEFRRSRPGWAGPWTAPASRATWLDNVKLLFEGGPEDRILLDDFEILQ